LSPFGRSFVTTMPQIISEGEMRAGHDAVSGARWNVQRTS
jgi:hypothetical protein